LPAARATFGQQLAPSEAYRCRYAGTRDRAPWVFGCRAGACRRGRGQGGSHLAALCLGGGRFLAIFDLKTGTVTQEVGYTSSFGDGSVAMDGPVHSPDGRTLWVPQSKDILRFDVAADGTVASSPTATAAVPHGANGDAFPSGLASSPDGKRLTPHFKSGQALHERGRGGQLALGF
jgi:hypothetical protein